MVLSWGYPGTRWLGCPAWRAASVRKPAPKVSIENVILTVNARQTLNDFDTLNAL